MSTFQTCTIREITKIRADIKIVGTIKKVDLYPGMVWVKQMGPDLKLFNMFQTWQNQGLWPTKWDEYEDHFKVLMNGPMKFYLDLLIQRLREDKNVAFACFCPNYRICHRSIIGRYVETKGIRWIRG